jgi:hypothetical protein
VSLDTLSKATITSSTLINNHKHKVAKPPPVLQESHFLLHDSFFSFPVVLGIEFSHTSSPKKAISVPLNKNEFWRAYILFCDW